MTIEEIKEQLREQGKDSNDFNITVLENGYSISPKWFYETKQKIKKENKPIIEDINDVAVTTAYVLEDTIITAETVAFLLLEVKNLKDEIKTLKGE